MEIHCVRHNNGPNLIEDSIDQHSMSIRPIATDSMWVTGKQKKANRNNHLVNFQRFFKNFISTCLHK